MLSCGADASSILPPRSTVPLTIDNRVGRYGICLKTIEYYSKEKHWVAAKTLAQYCTHQEKYFDAGDGSCIDGRCLVLFKINK